MVKSYKQHETPRNKANKLFFVQMPAVMVYITQVAKNLSEEVLLHCTCFSYMYFHPILKERLWKQKYYYLGRSFWLLINPLRLQFKINIVKTLELDQSEVKLCNYENTSNIIVLITRWNVGSRSSENMQNPGVSISHNGSLTIINTSRSATIRCVCSF